MQMLYNSDNFVIVQIDVAPAGAARATRSAPRRIAAATRSSTSSRARRSSSRGRMAQSFRQGVDALIEKSPTQEEFDEYIGRFSALMQQPVVLH